MRSCGVDFSSKRRGMGLAVIVIAVVVVAFGVWSLRSWNWDTAEGQVQSCKVTSTVRDHQTTRTYHCVVTWTAEGKDHEAVADFPGGSDRTGTQQKLLVHGDSAQGYGGRFYGLMIAGLGVALLIGGILLRRA